MRVILYYKLNTAAVFYTIDQDLAALVENIILACGHNNSH